MFPILFKIGPITLHTYGFFVALAFTVGISLAMHLGKKEGIPKENILDIGFYSLIGEIIGSRIFYVLIEYKYFMENPFDIIKLWEGGLVFYGGFIAVVIILLYYFKRNALPIWKVSDLFTPSLAIGHAIGRLGCLFAGCCHGKPTDMPWGITFTHPDSLAIKDIPLHPTQIYESFAETSIFIALLILRKRKGFHGQVFWTYVLLYSVARFIIEFFRGDHTRGFIYHGISTAQGVSIVLFLLAITFMVFLKRRKTETDS